MYFCHCMRAYRYILSLLLLFPLTLSAQQDTLIYLNSDTLFFSDGGWYFGEVADSAFNGFGIMQYADGTHYEGWWKDGLWEGEGHLTFADGDNYEGEFSGHAMNGQGIYRYSNGATYTGEFKDNAFNGFGYLEYADGGYYVGSFKDDMRHGAGALLDASDSTNYSGYFFNDNFIGNDIQAYREYEANPEYYYYDYVYDPKEIYGEKEKVYMALSANYSAKGFIRGRMMFCQGDQAWGLALGVNAHPPYHGKSGVMYDEDGSVLQSVRWDDYPSDELKEGTYDAFTALFDMSYRPAKQLYLGYGLGMGLEFSYRDCIVKGSGNTCTWMDEGTFYHKTRLKKVRFDFEVNAHYLVPIGEDGHLVVGIGYGWIEGLYGGFGLRF